MRGWEISGVWSIGSLSRGELMFRFIVAVELVNTMVAFEFELAGPRVRQHCKN
jgi:hypothetical protein